MPTAQTKELVEPAAVALVGVGISTILGCVGFLQGMSVASFGDALFVLLGTDITRFVLPVIFCRFFVPASGSEGLRARFAWAAVVGVAASANMYLRAEGRLHNFSLLFGTQAASYLLTSQLPVPSYAQLPVAVAGIGVVVRATMLGIRFEEVCVVFACAAACFFRKVALDGYLRQLPPACAFAVGLIFGGFVLPRVVVGLAYYFLPLAEISDMWVLMSSFAGVERLRVMTTELMIATVNIQVPLGFLGIAFLRRSQERQNRLLEIANGKLDGRGYTHLVVRYIFMVALPYMMQRTAMESVNGYVYGLFSRDLEMALRVEALLPAEGALLAAVGESNHTAASFAASLSSVASTSYGIVERKLFSLPKLALLPGMLCSKPWLVATVLPVSIALDAGKSQLVGFLSTRIEAYAQEIQELSDRRDRIEQHDTKHEELIRRGDIGELTRTRWQTLTKRLAELSMRSSALQSVRSFINWLYWQDFMTPGFECALGFLLEVQHITNVDIYLYIRVVEDSIDTLLTRSRLQAELASMETHAKRLRELQTGLAAVQARGRAVCQVEGSSDALRLIDVGFSRGPNMHVHIPSLTLQPGAIYAVTGANGCGKSTFFGILASCGRSRTALPIGTEMDVGSKLILPSDELVEITQRLYCPLHINPISWLLQRPDAKQALSAEELSVYEKKIALLFAELQFSVGMQNATNKEGGFGELDMFADREDWYGELSGGQRVKAELITKVFLRETCPPLMLLDEAFAPLDPQSKVLLQKKLKDFCPTTLILVIYHTDTNSGCVSGGFFDDNLHFENGTARLVGVC